MVHSNLSAYVLAGGRSSRMGQDKALLTLGGSTFLARAVQTLRLVAPTVTLLGDRTDLHGADRALPDLHPGCGPLGAIYTALVDCPTDWACFLPVDMPLLPPTLYATLITHYLAHPHPVNHPPRQPLISLLHTSILPLLEEALESGRYSVMPTLERAARELGGSGAGGSGGEISAESILLGHPGALGWSPTASEQLRKEFWFSNLNDPQEFNDAAKALE